MKRLLIVDDDPDVLESVALILEDGYAVAIARNGVDALKRVSAEHFDAMLLDLGMPQMDGAQVLREMATRKIQVPVILVSASHDLAAKARALGAADYLTKPFSAERLEAKVAALVGARAAASIRAAAQPRAHAGAVSGGSSGSPSAAAANPPHSSPKDPAPLSRTMPAARRAPDREIVERARDLMDARNSVLSELQHIPPDAFLLTCAKRLGVEQDGEVVMADLGSQLAFLDFCTHAFETRGRGALDLYRSQRGSAPAAGEQIVLDGMARARFSLFEVRRRLGADGSVMRDVIGGGRFTVIDDGAALKVGTLVVGRVLPFEEFALLAAPCRVVGERLAATLRGDLVAMGPVSRERLASGERKWQIELSAWLLRACFEAADAPVTWPRATSLAHH